MSSHFPECTKDIVQTCNDFQAAQCYAYILNAFAVIVVVFVRCKRQQFHPAVPLTGITYMRLRHIRWLHRRPH